MGRARDASARRAMQRRPGTAAAHSSEEQPDRVIDERRRRHRADPRSIWPSLELEAPRPPDLGRIRDVARQIPGKRAMALALGRLLPSDLAVLPSNPSPEAAQRRGLIRHLSEPLTAARAKGGGGGCADEARPMIHDALRYKRDVNDHETRTSTCATLPLLPCTSDGPPRVGTRSHAP